jgi:SAM-dependent methyltransferase
VSPHDPFGRTDELDEDSLQALVDRFEARGRHPYFTQMLEEYLDAMRLDVAGSALDLGCGTGLVARAIARRTTFTGEVTAVDISTYLLTAGAEFADKEGVGGRVRFVIGDARAVDAPDASFDAVTAHTLVSHVERPEAVVAEAARLVRPGGTVVVFDGDYASMTFGHADPVEGRRLDDAIIAGVAQNPRIMRVLPKVLSDVGLELLATYSYSLTEAGRAEYWASAINLYERVAAESGAVTAAEAEAWATELRKDSENGIFFGSCNYLAYITRRRE